MSSTLSVSRCRDCALSNAAVSLLVLALIVSFLPIRPYCQHQNITDPSRIYTPSSSITSPCCVAASTTFSASPGRRPTSHKAAQAASSGTHCATLLATLGGMTSPSCVQKVWAETESDTSRANSCSACLFRPSFGVSLHRI